MATKSRHLIVLQYLRENSDVDHYVSSVEILEKLKEEGLDVDVRTLRKDIECLQAAGYKIHVDSRQGRPTRYAWDSWDLSLPELQILVDAVSSSQFLTVDKSNEIISKLVKLSGPSGRDLLKPEFLVSKQAKAPNNEFLFNVQTIQKAIDTNRKITFRYMQYHLVPKKEGEGFEKKQVPQYGKSARSRLVVSPYAIVWNNGHYYMVGHSDQREKVCACRSRMDSMRRIISIRIPGCMALKRFRSRSDANQIFWTR